eukprot:2104177-Pleurochrysis_carterae.AAC.3
MSVSRRREPTRETARRLCGENHDGASRPTPDWHERRQQSKSLETARAHAPAAGRPSARAAPARCGAPLSLAKVGPTDRAECSLARASAARRSAPFEGRPPGADEERDEHATRSRGVKLVCQLTDYAFIHAECRSGLSCWHPQ